MARPPKKVLILGMPFEEALERFINVDVEEMSDRMARQRREKSRRRKALEPKRRAKTKAPPKARKRAKKQNKASRRK
jgi:hypothetical protein